MLSVAVHTWQLAGMMMLVECFISISFLLNDDGGGGIGLQLWKLKSIMFVVTVLKIENKNLHHAQSHKRLRNSSAAHLLLSFKELNLLSENQPSSKVQFTRPKQSRRSPPLSSWNPKTKELQWLCCCLAHLYYSLHILLNQIIITKDHMSFLIIKLLFALRKNHCRRYNYKSIQIEKQNCRKGSLMRKGDQEIIL